MPAAAGAAEGYTGPGQRPTKFARHVHNPSLPLPGALMRHVLTFLGVDCALLRTLVLVSRGWMARFTQFGAVDFCTWCPKRSYAGRLERPWLLRGVNKLRIHFADMLPASREIFAGLQGYRSW